MFLALSLDAINLAGSPSRLGVTFAGILFPVTFLAVSITSFTENPIPLPRLKISLLPPFCKYLTARICA